MAGAEKFTASREERGANGDATFVETALGLVDRCREHASREVVV